MSSMGEKVEGSGTSVLTLTFGVGNGSYHHNASDNAGLSDLKIYSEPGLELISVVFLHQYHLHFLSSQEELSFQPLNHVVL